MPRDRVILTAHGSRDPRSAAAVRAITAAVAARRPQDDVTCAFLDFDAPALSTALATSGGGRAVVAPLLLTPAYHARVDIPAIVDVALSRGAVVEVTAPLGGDDVGAAGLSTALAERLPHPERLDGVVVAAAGSRAVEALAVVDGVTAELSTRIGVTCRAGHVTGAGQPIAEAIESLRAAGSRRIGMAMLFVAPGLLPERAISAGRAAGVQAIAAPLGATPAVIELINSRIEARQLAAAR